MAPDLNGDDIANVLTALADLRKGYPERELAQGWEEAAGRVAKALRDRGHDDGQTWDQFVQAVPGQHPAIERFQKQLADWMVTERAYLLLLQKRTGALSDDEFEDLRLDVVDDLSALLGAEMANDFADEGGQDAAITAAEEWASSNISSRDGILVTALLVYGSVGAIAKVEELMRGETAAPGQS